jgi:hypothetical protein
MNRINNIFVGVKSCPVVRPKKVIHTISGKVCLVEHRKCFNNLGEMISWWQPRVNIDDSDELDEYALYCQRFYDEIKC